MPSARASPGLWSGNSPTYSFKLLGTELAPLLDQYYIASTYIVTWGADVPGMQEVVDKMTAAGRTCPSPTCTSSAGPRR